MIIDSHAHLVPQSWYHPKSPQAIFDIPRVIDEQAQAGVDLTIFGNNWIRTPQGKDPYDIVTEFNAFAAETTAQSFRLPAGAGMCAVPFGGDKLPQGDRAGSARVRPQGDHDQLERRRREYLDSPNAVPFFELVTDLDVPLFVHPPRVTIGAEKMEIFRLPEMVGPALRHHPLAVALHPHRRLRAVPPTLVMICSHVGGALPMLPGRLDFGYELRKDDSFGPWEPDVLPRAPSTYIEQLYYDTVSLHAPGGHLRGGDGRRGPRALRQRLPAGADSRWSAPSTPCGTSASPTRTSSKILGDNAARLLRLGQ